MIIVFSRSWTVPVRFSFSLYKCPSKWVSWLTYIPWWTFWFFCPRCWTNCSCPGDACEETAYCEETFFLFRIRTKLSCWWRYVFHCVMFLNKLNQWNHTTSHNNDCKEYCFLRCGVMLSARNSPVFWRNSLPPSSAFNSKLNKWGHCPCHFVCFSFSFNSPSCFYASASLQMLAWTCAY